MTDARVSVGFEAPAGSFRLEYRREDNLLPSEVAAAAEREDNVNAGCTLRPAPQLTEAQKQAQKELLHTQDQYAWPIRKLRLYPAGAATIRCSYGSTRVLHAETATDTEVLEFRGTDRAEVQGNGVPVALRPLGRIYDAQGHEIEDAGLVHRGAGLVTASQPIYGLVAADFSETYQVIELVVVPTNEDFDVMVAAFRGGQTASAVVPFEMLDFDTGQVAGVNCDGMTETMRARTNWPAPEPRYVIESVEYLDAVAKGESLSVTVTVKNINSAEGVGTVDFVLGMEAVAFGFSCEADGTADVSFGIRAPDSVGNYRTRASIRNNLLAEETGNVRVFDPESPDTWSEVSREMSDVSVNGVAIKRIDKVTMVTSTGVRANLVFDNSGVDGSKK